MFTENQTPALIQVVEDDPHLNMAISETLRSYDFEVESFANGALALEWLQNNRPDVILCDIMMPEMDGYTFLRHTRADARLRLLPFIFLTARISADDQRLAREIGVEDYLTKPIDSESLVIAIKNALRRQQAMRAEAQRQMDDLRNRIVNVLQHEFRTPLTFVLGYGEYLLEAIDTGFDKEELRTSINAILDGGHRLQRLIEGFLLLAELQNYIVKSEDMRVLNAYSFLHSAAQNAMPAVQDAGLQLKLLDQNKELAFNAHVDLLMEATRRLLDNAVSYRRPESHLITLAVDSAPPHVGLRIQDDGVGMLPEQVAALTKPFEQLDRANRTVPGAGISLALVHHIALLQAGKLEIESVVGEGSTVTLWLPAAVAPPA